MEEVVRLYFSYRDYNTITEWCKINEYDINEFCKDAIIQQVTTEKYGDLNKIFSKEEEKLEEVIPTKEKVINNYNIEVELKPIVEEKKEPKKRGRKKKEDVKAEEVIETPQVVIEDVKEEIKPIEEPPKKTKRVLKTK